MSVKSEMKWIVPPAAWALPDWKELWQYRSLMLQFAIKDFKVRYMQTWLGLFWAWANPLISAVLLYFVFNKVAQTKLPFNGLVFVMSGMVSWTFIASLIPESMQGMMGAQAMIKKIYFPKLILPLSKMAGAMVETVVTLLLFFVICIWQQQGLQWQGILLLPFYLLIMMVLGLGMSMWATVMVLISRDFLHVIPHMIRLGMFVCPIAYPAGLVPHKWQWLYFVNPVSGLIEGFRAMLFEGYVLHPFIWISGMSAVILLISGLLMFRKFEYTIADIL
jgi:lipopolysaccharide transport system permease protein